MTVAYDETGQPLSLIEIRPMDLGDILDATIRVYRRNPWTFVSILATFIGIPVFMSNMANRYITTILTQFMTVDSAAKFDYNAFVEAMRSQEFIYAIVVVALAILMMFFLQPIAQAAMVHAVSETILGHETGFHKSFRAIQPKIGKLILAYFDVIIISVIFTPFMVLFTLMMMNSESIYTGSWMAVMVITILLVPPSLFVLIFFSVKYLFIPQAMVLDDTGVVNSLRRSFHLSSGYWWRIFGTYVVVSFIVGIIGSLLGQTVNILEWGLKFTTVPVSAVVAISGAIMATLTLLISPITAISTTLIYYDLRIRKEGFDVILLASSIMGKSSKPEDHDAFISIG